MNNLEKLIAVGEAAFGKNWQSPLARYLGVSDRTIRNFISGKSRTPSDLSGRLAAAIEAKQAELDTAMEIIMTDVINGSDVTIDVIEQIVNNYEYQDEQDRKNAIDEINNSVYPETHLSDLEQIAKNWSTTIDLSNK